jgi:hypothetical protein
VSPGAVTGSFWNATANVDGLQLDPSGYIGCQRKEGAGVIVSKPAGYTNSDLIDFGLTNTTLGGIQVNESGNGVVYNTTSDERLKENIRPTTKGLHEVMKIQVRDYNFKSFLNLPSQNFSDRPSIRCINRGSPSRRASK